MSIQLINVFPEEIIDKYGGGHWKEVQAFNQLTETKNLNIIDFKLNTRKHKKLIDFCGYFEEAYVIFHYSFWPNLVKEVKFRYSKFNVIVRCINAEAFQHWHRFNITFSLSYHNIRNIYGSLRLLLQDQKCRYFTDHLLGISEWDNQHYWNFLPGSSKVHYCPYHSPWPQLHPHVQPTPWSARYNKVVCLAGGRDSIGLSQVQNFVKFARSVKSQQLSVDWNFELSPGVYRSDQPLDLEPVQLMSSLDEPWDLLCKIKVLAILTPLGFGTKTTIIDALAAGCHVLVDKNLAQRLPNNVQKLCHAVDMSKPRSFLGLMEQVFQEPKVHHINDELFAQAQAALENVLTGVRL
ncbi:MAG: hypothetical protein LVS60_13985 [Nodosilinea sp. LVE1205-7]